jgi:hypothetical protein
MRALLLLLSLSACADWDPPPQERAWRRHQAEERIDARSERQAQEPRWVYDDAPVRRTIDILMAGGQHGAGRVCTTEQVYPALTPTYRVKCE